MTTDVCIILFVKAPIRGHVKTRLAQDMDASIVTKLYQCFVEDIVRKIKASGLPLTVFYDPPGAGSLMQKWLGDDLAYAPQNGNDLGERMKQAFVSVFSSGIRRAVLMGSDLPDLPGEMLVNALSALSTHDAVIGPGMDGGYYLIGFQAQKFTGSVFQDIKWSTGAVYAATLERFAAAGLLVYPVSPWRDIDTQEDLLALIESLHEHPDHAPLTFAYLNQLKMTGDSATPMNRVESGKG